MISETIFESSRKSTFDAAGRYRTLLEINNAVIHNLTREELLAAVFSAVRHILPYDHIALGLFDPEINDQRLYGLGGDFSAGYFEIDKPVNTKNISSGANFDFRCPVLRRDLETDREYEFETHSLAEGIRSHIIVPLIVQGKAIGSFGIGSKNKNQYSEEDLQFLQEIGNQIAIGVANMVSYETLKTLREREASTAEKRRALLEINNAIITNLSEKDLLRAIFPALKRIVSFNLLGLSLYEPETDSYRIIALEGSHPTKHFTVGQKILRQDNYFADQFDLQHALLQPDLESQRQNELENILYAEGFRSYCAVPLRIDSKLIGALSVGAVGGDLTYTSG